MITIRYRPLAFARTYESVCLPVPRPSAWDVFTGRARPDPLGDAVARGPRTRERTTQSIPVAVDATLPAIAAAIARLRASLGRNGTAEQIMAVDAIALAVGTVRTEIEYGDTDALHRVLRGGS